MDSLRSQHDSLYPLGSFKVWTTAANHVSWVNSSQSLNPLTPEKQSQSTRRCTFPSLPCMLKRCEHTILTPKAVHRTEYPRELHEMEQSTGLESYRHAASACAPKSAPGSVNTDAVLPAARLSGTATEQHQEKRPGPNSLTHCYCTSLKSTNDFLFWAQFPILQSPIPIWFRRLRQENYESEDSLDYMVNCRTVWQRRTLSQTNQHRLCFS